MAIKFIDQADFNGKKVLARFDFNVPLSKTEPLKITDTSRIDLSLPSIKLMLDKGASKIVLMSHLGRPDGKVNKKYSLEPVATYLAEKLGVDVVLSESAIDAGVKQLLSLKETKIVLLENLRFYKEEEENNMEFAQALSLYGDIYVNDAFGVSHRKHASVHAIHQYFKGRAYGGLLLKKEVESIEKLLNSPEKPFIGIVGGAKVADKIQTIEKLLVNVDKIFIGGAMAYPFLKAKGFEVGKSLCSEEDFKLAKTILGNDRGNKIILPVDHIVSDSLEGTPTYCHIQNISSDKMGLDIGEKTLNLFADHLGKAKTIFWNGPMGLFENKNYAKGTMKLAELIAHSHAFSVVGGGDSVAAVNQSGFADKFSHVSTGGGASLEYIEKGELPGIRALKFGV
jgi:phosphoglycerate kinase